MGTVEDNQDPLSLGRVRVRIIGHHNQDITAIPTNSLPYASIIHSVDNPVIGGIGTSVTLPIGTRVFGFFVDGESRCQPVVLGVLSGEHLSVPTQNLQPDNSHQQPNIEPLLGHSNNIETSCPSGELLNNNSVNQLKPTHTSFSINGVQIDRSQFVYPCTGYVSDYYLSRNGKHFGVDLAVLGTQKSSGADFLNGRYRGDVGVPIYAIADGVVLYTFKHSQGQKQVPTAYDFNNRTDSRSFGNAVVIRHNLNGIVLLSVYAHLGTNQDASLDSDTSGVSVAPGTPVTKGQQIGTCGRTHNLDGPTHCHFEIRVGESVSRGASNHVAPWIIFPKMHTVHTSILSHVNSTISYKTIPHLQNSDLPMQSLEVPV
jgi:murein DD-endopeptidase MepM/ murein hydrolase activator NlpD